MQSLTKVERKKQSQILKIIEEWLKCYQVQNHLDSNDEKVLQEELNAILVKEKAIED